MSMSFVPLSRHLDNPTQAGGSLTYHIPLGFYQGFLNRKQSEVVNCSIVIGVSRGWLKTSYMPLPAAGCFLSFGEQKDPGFYYLVLVKVSVAC